MRRFIVISLCVVFIGGCSSIQIKTPRSVVLNVDKIYTLPAGKAVDLMLDKKPITVTFPEDMKVTTIDHLLATERKLNDAVLDKAKADKSRNKWIGIFGSILTVLAGALAVFVKTKGGFNLTGGIK